MAGRRGHTRRRGCDRGGGRVRGEPLVGASTRAGLVGEGPSAETRRFEDTAVAPTVRYRYQVEAVGPRTVSVPSPEISASPPLPPITAAVLSGTYEVKLSVRAVHNLDEFEGIQSPKVGDHHVESWSFASSCGSHGPCSARYFDLKPLLRHRGRTFEGSVGGSNATCTAPNGTKSKVPVRRAFHLIVTRARMKGAIYQAVAFEGTMTVSFRCDGRADGGTASVVGAMKGLTSSA